MTTEQELLKRECYLATLVEIQQMLLGFEGDRQQLYQRVLPSLGQVSSVSRVYVFENSRNSQGQLVMSQQAEWCAASITPQLHNPLMQNLPYQGYFLNWVHRLEAGHPVAETVTDLPEAERVILQDQGILSILMLPLMVQGSLLGFIGFDDCATARSWQQSEMHLLQATASAISMALERKQAEFQLQQSKLELEDAVRQRTVTLQQAIAQLQEEIEERQQAEAALQHSQATYRALLNAIPDLMLRVSRSGICLDYMPGRNFPTLWTEVNWRGKHLLEFMPTDLVQQRMHYIEQAFLTGDIQIYEQEIIREHGVCTEEVRIVISEDQTALMIVRDISHRKQSEIKLKQRTDDLEQALQELKRTQTQLVQSEKMSSLGQLVAGVAHEINNPVNFISGNLIHATRYTEDLLNLLSLYQQHYSPIPLIEAEAEAIDLDFIIEDLPKLMASMKVGADRIQEIVAALRIFSRMDEAEVKAVDLHQGLDSTLMILQNRIKPQPKRHGIRIIKEYGKLPLVECYAGQLNQVFMNIISNSIDALEELDRERKSYALESKPSTILIRTQLTETDQVRIYIEDNGPGIPEAIQKRLFDPFFTTKPVGKGTGMGLSISYQIVVEKHRGNLFCRSSPEQGTAFVIEIPLHQTQASPLNQ